MARVAEVAALTLLLILAGVTLAAPGYPIEQRVQGLTAIVAVLVGLALVGRRR
jgi:hypothetical protein